MESWTKAELNYVRVRANLVWSLTSKQGMYPHGPARNNGVTILRCRAYGRLSEDHVVIHSQKERRYQCKRCRRTFTETTDTTLLPDAQTQVAGSCSGNVAGPRMPTAGYRRCLWDRDERTLARWQRESGLQCKRVHEHMVEAGRVEASTGPGRRDPCEGRRWDLLAGLCSGGEKQAMAGWRGSATVATDTWSGVYSSGCAPVAA